jgi:hypothetical protein
MSLRRDANFILEDQNLNPNDVDLRQASYVYGIANTPLFLVRKLQDDPAIRALGTECPGEQLVDALRLIAALEPASAVEAARPYAFLVALWFNPNIEHLREASTIQAPVHKWYAYIAQVLLETFSPVQSQSIEVAGELRTPVISIGSTAATNLEIIIP